MQTTGSWSDSPSTAIRATVLGNREALSGESRLTTLSGAGGKAMNPPRIHAFVLWGFLTSLVTGCSGGLELVLSAIGPTVDLSGTSAEKSNLVDYCNCITLVEGETDEGELRPIWTPSKERHPADFVLSPGKYHVTASEDFRKVGTVTDVFIFAAKPGHKYGMHRLYCVVAPADWVFLEFRCPLDAYYAGFIWLKDQTTGEILKKASIGYD